VGYRFRKKEVQTKPGGPGPPLAITATEISGRHPEASNRVSSDGGDPFRLPGLHFVRETAESIAIKKVKGGVVIMADSGMATGGQIRHHLQA
jgi:metallo-beta-lactamase family protein